MSQKFVIALFATAIPLVAFSDQDIRIRTEYSGADTPTYMIFAFTLHVLQEESSVDRDGTIRSIHSHMKLGSESSAEEFLQLLLQAATTLEDQNRQLELAILCPPNPNRTVLSIYRAMDAIDDSRAREAEIVFDDFVKSLSELERGPFLAWMEDEKKGYTHRALDHQSMYESSGRDVKVDIIGYCEALEHEQLRRDEK
jgi:hypothetical protein